MISAQEITKDYNNSSQGHVLNGVTLYIAPGEFVSISGRSGSGKTTLLNILGTLDHPSSGRVIMDGVDVNTLNSKEKADFRRSKIGFVFQLFYLIPHLTVLENVMLPLKPYQRKLTFNLEARAREVIDCVGLGQLSSNYPNYLSGGEQQRVAIARALINYPKIVLADEPTGNLDTDTGNEIIGMLKRFSQEQGITILMVTHNTEILAQTQRTLHLINGKIDSLSGLNGES